MPEGPFSSLHALRVANFNFVKRQIEYLVGYFNACLGEHLAEQAPEEVFARIPLNSRDFLAIHDQNKCGCKTERPLENNGVRSLRMDVEPLQWGCRAFLSFRIDIGDFLVPPCTPHAAFFFHHDERRWSRGVAAGADKEHERKDKTAKQHAGLTLYDRLNNLNMLMIQEAVVAMMDITYTGAAIAGLLSFLSPCILPIVPFYLSYLAGVGMNQISADAEIDPTVRRRAVMAASFFAAGVITVFMGLGAAATLFGQTLREYFDILRWVAAAIIILMGLHFLGVLRIPILYRQLRADAGNTSNVSLVGAYVIGLAFAFGWTPCVGPVLAAILFMAAGSDTATHGATLLFVYGVGMTAPFVLAAFFIRPFMRWMSSFRRHLGIVEKLMGGLLIIFGLLIATNSMNYIAQWMLETMPIFGAIG